jgi:Family of unknown function (DUF5681)
MANRRSNGQFERGHMLGRRFQPGASGNPNGRPRHDRLTLALRDKLAEELPGATEQTVAEAIAGALITEALSGNVQAIREIADRTEGKPTQPHIAVDLSDEGLNAEIEHLLNKEAMANQRLTENRAATNESEVLPPTIKLLS